MAKQWSDTEWAGEGGCVSFMNQSSNTVKIKHIVVGKWNGKIPGSKNSEANEEKDSIAFVNDDVVSGELQSIVDGKVVTKYNYGVAFMQMPFFLVADILSGEDGDGFSLIYHRAIDIAAVFWLITGLFLLFGLLRKKYSFQVSVIALMTILFGTNLFYYAVIDTGMSHIYSFALFSLFLFLVFNKSMFEARMTLFVVLISLVASLIVVIRPTSILFIIAAIFITHTESEDIQRYFKWKYLVIFPIVFFIVFLPQFLYWKYANGSFIHYSYGNESFVNWNNPQIIKTLFSPNNGLILYNPIVLLIFIGIYSMFKNNIRDGLILGILFVVLVYVVSSWWLFSFGCGYSSRNFVEYYSLFVFPMAYFINRSFEKKGLVLIISVLLISVFIVYNMKMIYTWDRCWFGSYDWDWNEYIHLLKSGTH